MTAKRWIHGLIAAIINGAASGVVVCVADPMKFNFGDGLKPLLSVSAILGILGAANYLKQSPLPEDDSPAGIPPTPPAPKP